MRATSLGSRWPALSPCVGHPSDMDDDRLDILWAERTQIQGVIRFLRYGLGLATGVLGIITTALALGGS